MIHATGLTRRYGAAAPVVDAVDLQVAAGEVVGLIGPNGGGKSTLLLLLAGLVRPSAGEVRVRGLPAHELPTSAAGTVGLITAEPGLYPALTVRENLVWFAGLSGRPAAWTERALIGPARELGLDAHLDRPVAELSSGQRQKASLVRALLLAPSVLLLDEPTANLDPLSAHTLLARIRALADSGLAVVLCTHDLRAADPICDRLVVFDRTIRATRPGSRGAPPSDELHTWLRQVLGEPEAGALSALSPVDPPPSAPAGPWHVAKREWREQLRQPAMLAVCAALLTVVAGLSLGALVLLELLGSDPSFVVTLAGLLGGQQGAEVFLAGSITATLTAWNFLVFSQYLGFVGVMAGHGILHDRQTGALPFLLLAPISRGALLVGKVLGAVGPLTAVYLLVALTGGLASALLPVSAVHPELGPRGLGWWIAVLAAGPAWAGFVGATCAVISAVARDVRLAQQAVWFVVFFVQVLVAFLITGALGSPLQQLAATALGALATATALAVGTSVLARDLAR